MSWTERWLLVQSLLLLPIVAASLRFVGFQKTYHWLDRLPGRSPQTDLDSVGQSVDTASRKFPIYQPTCLSRSLVLWHLLRRRGVPAVLQIGVRKENEELLSHAWVESDGRVVNDKPDVARHFSPIDFQQRQTRGRA
jgi:hypothetical protein